MKFRDILFVSLISLAVGSGVALASETNGTIPDDRYAWGENMGWVNFGCDNCSVAVTDSAVTGYAWNENYGWINLSPTNGGITNNSEGNLGGDAWAEGLGWISFDDVVINSSGEFTGTAGAVNTAAGRISFDCTNCNVTTDWRPASSRTEDTTPSPSVPGNGPPGGGLFGWFVNLFGGQDSGGADTGGGTDKAVSSDGTTPPAPDTSDVSGSGGTVTPDGEPGGGYVYEPGGSTSTGTVTVPTTTVSRQDGSGNSFIQSFVQQLKNNGKTIGISLLVIFAVFLLARLIWFLAL